jgi:hypothetical protein
VVFVVAVLTPDDIKCTVRHIGMNEHELNDIVLLSDLTRCCLPIPWARGTHACCPPQAMMQTAAVVKDNLAALQVLIDI